MKFFITYDADITSGLSEITYGMTKALGSYFADRFYEDSGIEMAVILMCRRPVRDFKQRIRFVKKENCLYMDIILDLDVMNRTDEPTRKRIVGEKIVNEVPQIVARKKFKDFDLSRFARDLREWFENQDWIQKIFSDEEVVFGE
jgi:hypothetical protein